MLKFLHLIGMMWNRFAQLYSAHKNEKLRKSSYKWLNVRKITHSGSNPSTKTKSVANSYCGDIMVEFSDFSHVSICNVIEWLLILVGNSKYSKRNNRKRVNRRETRGNEWNVRKGKWECSGVIFARLRRFSGLKFDHTMRTTVQTPNKYSRTLIYELSEVTNTKS